MQNLSSLKEINSVGSTARRHGLNTLSYPSSLSDVIRKFSRRGKPSPLGDMVPLPPPRVTSAGKVVRKIQISKYFHINRGCQVLPRPWLQSVVAPDLGRGHAPVGEP